MDSIVNDPVLFTAAGALSLIGFAFVSAKLASFVKTLLDVYVLSGVSVKKKGPLLLFYSFALPTRHSLLTSSFLDTAQEVWRGTRCLGW